MSLFLRECTRTQFDVFSRIVDCEWASYHDPYHPFMNLLIPGFGADAAARSAAIAESKERQWQWHNDHPGSHWLYVKRKEFRLSHWWGALVHTQVRPLGRTTAATQRLLVAVIIIRTFHYDLLTVARGRAQVLCEQNVGVASSIPKEAYGDTSTCKMALRLISI